MVAVGGGRGLNPLRNPIDPLLSCGAPDPLPLDCKDITGDEAFDVLDGPCGAVGSQCCLVPPLMVAVFV